MSFFNLSPDDARWVLFFFTVNGGIYALAFGLFLNFIVRNNGQEDSKKEK